MNRLETRLRARAPLRFRDFMHAALFDPEEGYYSAHIRAVGRRGDFATGATLDSTLAHAVARWLKNGRPGCLIEIGAGDGSLAEGVLRSLGWRRRRRTAYRIVESSAPLREVQRRRLSRFPGVGWHQDMASALEHCGGAAWIFSNELVDAFPVTLLGWSASESRWRELTMAAAQPAGWRLEAGELARLPEHGSLAGRDDFADGQRVERHDSYIDWLASWLGRWRAGEMLTIDYGDLFPALYHRRPRGTLRAYFAHQRLESFEEITANPGRQDITADVDFTDLGSRTAALGLETLALQTQADWMNGLGVTGGISGDPDAAGGAFRVLRQRRKA